MPSGASAGGAAPPNILFSRSVDRAGRKRETTLGIAGLHFEIGAFPGAAPDQFELPSGASKPGKLRPDFGDLDLARLDDGSSQFLAQRGQLMLVNLSSFFDCVEGRQDRLGVDLRSLCVAANDG
jgi:hypothetical protein